MYTDTLSMRQNQQDFKDMIKQVIVIRKDLKMRRGKEIAQGSHASMAFLLNSDATKEQIDEWLKGGQTKVCVSVDSEEELIDIQQKALEVNLIVNMITDLGRTEFNGIPTKTCLAIGPNNAEEIDKITGHLKLR